MKLVKSWGGSVPFISPWRSVRICMRFKCNLFNNGGMFHGNENTDG